MSGIHYADMSPKLSKSDSYIHNDRCGTTGGEDTSEETMEMFCYQKLSPPLSEPVVLVDAAAMAQVDRAWSPSGMYLIDVKENINPIELIDVNHSMDSVSCVLHNAIQTGTFDGICVMDLIAVIKVLFHAAYPWAWALERWVIRQTAGITTRGYFS